jgi:hypothetical protein
VGFPVSKVKGTVLFEVAGSFPQLLASLPTAWLGLARGQVKILSVAEK